MKKTVRELKSFAKIHYSLGGKLFRTVLLMALIIGIAAIAFGFFLYSSAVNREFRTKTYNLAKTAALELDLVKIRSKATDVIGIYDSLSDEEQLDCNSAEYRSRFIGIEDMAHNKLRWDIHSLQLVNDAIAGYVAFLDLDKNRMVFIADGDQAASYCPPGYWDAMKPKDLEVLMNGNKVSLLDRMNGVGSMNSIITTMDRYGYRCTAGSRLFKINDYPVFIFYDTDMTQAAHASRLFLLQYFGILLIIAVIAALLIILWMRRKIVAPINQLADAAQSYAQDSKSDHRSGSYFDKLNIHTGDEIENLSLTMKDMEQEMADYVDHLTRVTAEKERIETELDLASRIQEGMIPHIYPAFPERSEFDIYATMNTAKEVGGDFYDFFLLDEDHLGIVMADVSGKGIPAALFMMASKIMISNYSHIDFVSPAKILERVNHQICQNNSMEMFVTVWLGIVELSTGKVTAANAGHEYPAIRRSDGKFELYKDPHGFVIGGMDNLRYKDYTIELSPGDWIFQYTDGVTEAANSEGELFGTDRMIEALNQKPITDPKELLPYIKEAIDEFSGDAEQFDDITMLAFQYCGPQK